MMQSSLGGNVDGGYSEKRKKKYAVIVGVSSFLVVTMFIGTAVMSSGSGGHERAIKAGNKLVVKTAVNVICSSTDYKETCVASLETVRSPDPRNLIKSAFEFAIKSIQKGINQAAIDLRMRAKSDRRTREALENCVELMENSVEDLRKSNEKFAGFAFTRLRDIAEDLGVWLSGAITYQQTCIDGFEGIDSDAAEIMERIFKTAQQLTSNGLAIATNLDNLLKFFHIPIPFLTTSRDSTDEDSIEPVGRQLTEFPDWVTGHSRRLLAEKGGRIRANAVVAKDGSGQYRTITEALAAVPKNNERRFVIYIKSGVYAENVELTKKMTHVMFIGDGPTKTIVTGNLSFHPNRISTYRTSTVAVNGDWFMAKDMAFENTAGPEGHQAVALRVSADYAVFYNCRMDGYQDTLYVHTHRQFYRDCRISGTIDFVFGDAKAVFQNCQFVVRRPMENQQCIVTAQGRKDRRETTGIVIHKSRIMGDPTYLPVKTKNRAYLGRPWKEYSRTVIMNSLIDDIIDPEGWMKWNETFALDTLYYAEYQNTGPGSDQAGRVRWNGIQHLSDSAATQYTPDNFLRGNTWIPKTRVPYAAN
ncbi:PREDICTED: putative pectinesterase/pectinesterase inhibitor 43 [Tarenaya hassleriana]|uniref:putative pectinesterase/pectinesterase inhibitor 43 n=1 Tax=Tarenaya hassleriana TaxID=28532 RepID=UPI00053C8F51|nr:PREDICTED: putative pectinesterase/pectinesterase inhibitor 43 [Tarenaya hassleriana]